MSTIAAIPASRTPLSPRAPDEDGVTSSFGGTYVRRDGTWSYAWGGAVQGAVDVTIVDALRRRDGVDIPRSITEDDVAWACRVHGTSRPLLTVSIRGERRLVVGLDAPELQVSATLTVADVSELAGVSKATIDSYRYRGTLPEPQIVLARTPLWVRPVIARWLASRPGAGWRSDVYRGGAPTRTLPITRAREANLARAAAARR